MYASVWGLFLCTLAICSKAFANSNQNFHVLPKGTATRHIHSLTAVKVRRPLQQRHEILQTEHECHHHYVDHSSVLSGSTSRFAKTSMKYKWPALVLEDIEDVVNDISCSNSLITLHFGDQSALDFARRSWKPLKKFLVITSHRGCNEDGARGIYLASIRKPYEDSLKIELVVKSISFKEAYKTMAVKFGTSDNQYRVEDLRVHDGLRRRQVVPSSVSYPPAPTRTPQSSSVKADISFSTDPDREVLKFSQSTTEILKDTVTVKCKSCSLNGTIELTEGEFIVTDSDTLPFKALDFIEHGYFKAAVDGLKAHIELDTTLELSTKRTFDFSILTVPIPGFSIPGIAAVGPIFQPHIVASFETKGTLGFGYGFDLEVPDNSSMTLNIGNLTRSTSTGFNDSQINAIPLTASAPEITITFGLGLRAEVLLGIDILNGQGSMTAGFFFDLPALSVGISQMSGINAQCEKVADSSTVDEFLAVVFPNLTHVAPKVDIGTGVQAGARLNVANAGIHETIGTETVLTGTSFPLPTACLSWDGVKAAFASPTVSLPETSTEAAPAQGTANKKGNPNLGNKDMEIPGFGGAVWTFSFVVFALSFIVLA